MALDISGLFTIIGKYVKTINTLDGYIAAVETLKEEIRDEYELLNLHDLYSQTPSLIAAYQDSVTSAIDSLVLDVANQLLLDRDFVIENMNVLTPSLQGVLKAIHDALVDNAQDIETSIVTLDSGGGFVDTDLGSSTANLGGRLFCWRTLDGVNAPGNGVAADLRYLGLESQLAKSTNVRSEIVSDINLASATVQLYSKASETRPYVYQDEEPGIGPTLSNVDSAVNQISANYDFINWTGDTPNNWSLTGGVETTDWLDSSGTGAGPLRINTVAVKAIQQVSGLQRRTAYFAGVYFAGLGTVSEDVVVGIKIRNLADTIDYMTQETDTAVITGPETQEQAFGFFYLSDSHDPNDVYVEIEYVSESVGANYASIRKVTVAPAVYYNGLAWAWWQFKELNTPTSSAKILANGTVHGVGVANDDSGVFQAFFRKAFNVQLPTADAPTILDSLAI